MLSKATIKYIQSLQQKKGRNEHSVFVAEGTKMLEEMLSENQLEVLEVFATELWWTTLPLSLQEKYSTVTTIVKDFQLKQISTRESAIGGLAIFKQRINFLQPDYENEIVIALTDLQDPGNLGTIIRTADWFGIKNIICSSGTVDCYNPKVVQSTMGSIGRVALHYTDLESWLSKTESKIFAARIEGADISNSEKPSTAVLLVGNEAKGIPESYNHLKCESVSIKKIGAPESLNAAVAAGILMFAFCGNR